jgi:heptaprenyl diphosphate synthase
MNSEDIFASIRPELNRVEEQLYAIIDTGNPFLKDASEHLIKAGGKRLRPAFVLLSGSFFLDDLEYLIPMAVSLELVHMATLVHDDVIDNSPYRRGRPTVKAVYGNRLSVYSGDYLLAKSLALAASYGRDDVISLMAQASVRLCEGEITQMQTCYDVDQEYKDYLKRIEQKTALLMSLSCHLGALLAGGSPEMVRILKAYGLYLGMAFQIIDDILDFTADQAVLGKPTGSDLRQGIITLPALFALRHSQGERLRAIIENPEKLEQEAESALNMVKASGGIEYSYQIAQRFVDKARQRLVKLEDSQARNLLDSLASFVCDRDF